MKIRTPGCPGCAVVLAILAFCLHGFAPFRASADTIFLQIEFSEGPVRSYALSKTGSFSSGVIALTALLQSLGGAAQRFDEPFTTPAEVAGNQIQWWRWEFGLSLTGMSLHNQANGDWKNNYWAVYTRNSANSPFVMSSVGLADLTPTDGSWITLKFSSFNGGSSPLENVPSEAVSFLAPTNPDPPRILSARQISAEVLELVFSTTPGATYRLDVSSALPAETWDVWVSPFVATSSATSFTVAMEPDAPRKFFRLALLQ